MLIDPILRKKLLALLEEDLHFADVSSDVIPKDLVTTAEIICKQGGVLAGGREAQILFSIVGVQADMQVSDGAPIAKGDVIMTLEGLASNILSAERTALNILHRMCAIATTTRKAVLAAREINPPIRVAATRKTTPGMRVFEKQAVILGGGDPHRWSLDDMIMLKDTHKALFGGDVAQMVQYAKEHASFTKKIEVEVENLAEAVAAAQAGADIIMFDNMAPGDVSSALQELDTLGLREHVIYEASGGITVDTLAEYAGTGVDVVSMGSLTMYPSERVDLSLEIKIPNIL
ncbi:MAG TPA: carboxylating nicotinate-nucleotide diphosphorylase [Candidatus Lokiarchaeia archaeon]|nr:carboxylating nicotinate-nucleotide diphosphorylase [Candidatus Lokiarchaeia archaeon]